MVHIMMYVYIYICINISPYKMNAIHFRERGCQMSEAVMDVDLRCYRPACCRKDVPTSRPILGETFFFSDVSVLKMENFVKISSWAL